MFSSWSEGIKLRAFRYLLHRYLGQFLQEKVSLNQMDIQLASSSCAEITDVNLDVEAINAAFTEANVPFEMVDGFIGTVKLDFPLSSVLHESTALELHGLEITVRPMKREINEEFEFESMIESMSTSMSASTLEVAEECLRDEKRESSDDSSSQKVPFFGVEKFAHALDIVLSMAKMTLVNSIIRIEHLNDPKKRKGIALELKIARVYYYDKQNTTSASDPEGKKRAGPPKVDTSKTSKAFEMSGVQIFTDEFLDKISRQESRTSSILKSQISKDLVQSEVFHSAAEILSSQVSSVTIHSNESDMASSPRSNLVKILEFDGDCNLDLMICTTNGAKVDVKCRIFGAHVLLWPSEIHAITKLSEVMSKCAVPRGNGSKSGANASSAGFNMKPLTDDDYERIEDEMKKQFSSRQSDIKGNRLTGGMDASWHSSYGELMSQSGTQFFSMRNNENKNPRTVLSNYNEEQYGGNMQFTLNIHNVSLLIMQKNLISEQSNTNALDRAEQRSISSKYFSSIQENFAGKRVSAKEMRSFVGSSISFDHIWLYASPLVLEWSSNKLSGNTHTSAYISAGTVEIWEHLFSLGPNEQRSRRNSSNWVSSQDDISKLQTFPICLEILNFNDETFGKSPGVTIRMSGNKIKRKSSFGEKSILNSDKVVFEIDLAPFHTDIDITILERMYELLIVENMYDVQSFDSSESEVLRSSAIRSEWEINVSSSSGTINLRFPELDMRSPMERLSFPRRNLQKESLVFELSNIKFSTCVSAKNGFVNPQEYLLNMENIVVLMRQFVGDDNPVHIGQISAMPSNFKNADAGNSRSPFLKIITKSKEVSNEDICIDDVVKNVKGGSKLVDEELGDWQDVGAPTLFKASQRFIDGEDKGINRVAPTESEKAEQFKGEAKENSKMIIEVEIPVLVATFCDKMSLEILYNRIFNDLVMWEPFFTTLVVNKDGGSMLMSEQPKNRFLSTFNEARAQIFRPCQGAKEENSESEEETQLPYFPSVSQQVRDAKDKSKKFSSLDKNSVITAPQFFDLQNDLTLILKVQTGTIMLYTPANGKSGTFLDAPANHHGEVWINIEDANLFVVSGYKGQPDLVYTYFMSRNAQLYHETCLSDTQYPIQPFKSLIS